jgi:flagellar biosynthesis GTPase FlhF
LNDDAAPSSEEEEEEEEEEQQEEQQEEEEEQQEEEEEQQEEQAEEEELENDPEIDPNENVEEEDDHISESSSSDDDDGDNPPANAQPKQPAPKTPPPAATPLVSDSPLPPTPKASPDVPNVPPPLPPPATPPPIEPKAAMQLPQNVEQFNIGSDDESDAVVSNVGSNDTTNDPNSPSRLIRHHIIQNPQPKINIIRNIPLPPISETTQITTPIISEIPNPQGMSNITHHTAIQHPAHTIFSLPPQQPQPVQPQEVQPQAVQPQAAQPPLIQQPLVPPQQPPQVQPPPTQPPPIQQPQMPPQQPQMPPQQVILAPLFFQIPNQNTQSFMNIPNLFPQAASSSTSTQLPQIQNITNQFIQTAPRRVMSDYAENLYHEFLAMMIGFSPSDAHDIEISFHSALQTYLFQQLGEHPNDSNYMDWYARYIVIIQQYINKYRGNIANLPSYKAKSKAAKKVPPLKAISDAKAKPQQPSPTSSSITGDILTPQRPSPTSSTITGHILSPPSLTKQLQVQSPPKLSPQSITHSLPIETSVGLSPPPKSASSSIQGKTISPKPAPKAAFIPASPVQQTQLSQTPTYIISNPQPPPPKSDPVARRLFESPPPSSATSFNVQTTPITPQSQVFLQPLQVAKSVASPPKQVPSANLFSYVSPTKTTSSWGLSTVSRALDEQTPQITPQSIIYLQPLQGTPTAQIPATSPNLYSYVAPSSSNSLPSVGNVSPTEIPPTTPKPKSKGRPKTKATPTSEGNASFIPTSEGHASYVPTSVGNVSYVSTPSSHMTSIGQVSPTELPPTPKRNKRQKKK